LGSARRVHSSLVFHPRVLDFLRWSGAARCPLVLDLPALGEPTIRFISSSFFSIDLKGTPCCHRRPIPPSFCPRYRPKSGPFCVPSFFPQVQVKRLICVFARAPIAFPCRIAPPPFFRSYFSLLPHSLSPRGLLLPDRRSEVVFWFEDFPAFLTLHIEPCDDPSFFGMNPLAVTFKLVPVPPKRSHPPTLFAFDHYLEPLHVNPPSLTDHCVRVTSESLLGVFFAVLRRLLRSLP